MTVQKTYVPKANDVQEEWHLVDATEQHLGHLATKIARVLLGKHKPDFTPGFDTGSYVVVINAQQVAVTGSKLEDKFYYRHSNYPGGLKSISLRDQLAKHPDRVIRRAVWGMLPHGKYGRALLRKLKVYGGPEHPHMAQQPKPIR